MTPQELIEQARRAAEQAYAPYSGYAVGAALLCVDGRVYLGCNVENASFGLSNCAERTAVFRAVADGERRFSALAVAASTPPAPYPCGACRQVLSEFCPPEMPIHIATADGIETLSMESLLPHGFRIEPSHE